MTQVIGNIAQYHFRCLEHDICTSAKNPSQSDKMGSMLAAANITLFLIEGKGLPKLLI